MSHSSDAPAELTAILTRLRQTKRVAIFTHERPDPDALGSQAAAAILLQRLGAAEIHRIQFAECPPPYRFLQDGVPGNTLAWKTAPPEAAALDTILLVDTCTYQQLDPAAAFLKSRHDAVVAIDHHASRDDIGPRQFLYTDTSAAACVEILWQLARAAGISIDAALAQPLLAGLAGDTGWFRFDSVTPRTHAMAADLVAHVNPAALYQRLMQNESKPKLALMERALASLRWAFGDRFACMTLRLRDFADTGAVQSQTEYLVDMPMMVQTTEVVALLTETDNGRIRASLRSKNTVDVNRLCNQFGGGGHARAAGCRLDGPLDQAVNRLTAAVGHAL